MGHGAESTPLPSSGVIAIITTKLPAQGTRIAYAPSIDIYHAHRYACLALGSHPAQFSKPLHAAIMPLHAYSLVPLPGILHLQRHDLQRLHHS